jgi:hypothetical protein
MSSISAPIVRTAAEREAERDKNRRAAIHQDTLDALKDIHLSKQLDSWTDLIHTCVTAKDSILTLSDDGQLVLTAEGATFIGLSMPYNTAESILSAADKLAEAHAFAKVAATAVKFIVATYIAASTRKQWLNEMLKQAYNVQRMLVLAATAWKDRPEMKAALEELNIYLNESFRRDLERFVPHWTVLDTLCAIQRKKKLLKHCEYLDSLLSRHGISTALVGTQLTVIAGFENVVGRLDQLQSSMNHMDAHVADLRGALIKQQETIYTFTPSPEATDHCKSMMLTMLEEEDPDDLIELFCFLYCELAKPPTPFDFHAVNGKLRAGGADNHVLTNLQQEKHQQFVKALLTFGCHMEDTLKAISLTPEEQMGFRKDLLQTTGVVTVAGPGPKALVDFINAVTTKLRQPSVDNKAVVLELFVLLVNFAQTVQAQLTQALTAYKLATSGLTTLTEEERQQFDRERKEAVVRLVKDVQQLGGKKMLIVRSR